MRRFRAWNGLLAVLTGLVLATFTYIFRRQLIADLARRYLRIRPARYAARVQRGLRIPTRDGLYLATDHHYPSVLADQPSPTLLIRSPYGRNLAGGPFGLLLDFLAERFAERGYHVLLQDTRGRFDSPGEFNPPFDEPADGRATLDWLHEQPWYNGSVGLWGPSYLGIVQWAIAGEPEVKAMVPIVTSSELQMIIYPDGVLDLGLALRWLGLFQALDERRSLLQAPRLLRRVERTITPGFETLPVGSADTLVLGNQVPYYQTWLEHPPIADDPFWQAGRVIDPGTVTVPVHLIGGWYDFFLRGLLSDYATMRVAGRTPYLTIGPWFHFSDAMVTLDSMREGLRWFDAYLQGNSSALRRLPVRIFVMGAKRWCDLPDWPPPASSVNYYLHPAHRLDHVPSTMAGSADHYRYDPADPTPALGGTQFSPWAGPKDNRVLEARPDVLTYTTQVLRQAVEVIGPVRLVLYVRSSLDYADFLGRLCDVYPDGRSVNACDGLFRLEPGRGTPQPDGSMRIEIDMWATAIRFRRGHRIRLQVSSGAHPRWSRNLGSAESAGQCAVMYAADQTIYHDEAHPSALILPVVNGA